METDIKIMNQKLNGKYDILLYIKFQIKKKRIIDLIIYFWKIKNKNQLTLFNWT